MKTVGKLCLLNENLKLREIKIMTIFVCLQSQYLLTEMNYSAFLEEKLTLYMREWKRMSKILICSKAHSS